ncbi:hypothetical protein JXB12_09445 [candidate division KSB1 bacterium]|nr:hypothetical protein [candidate division KSB1 bacterium]
MGILSKLFGEKSVQSPLIEATLNRNAQEVHHILVNASDPSHKSEALYLALKNGFNEIADDLKKHGTRISTEQEKLFKRKYPEKPKLTVEGLETVPNQVIASRVLVRETTTREIMVEAIKMEGLDEHSINLAGLSLIKQGNCGYLLDRDYIVRAFWVLKLQDAGSNGQLITTLHLYQSRGELLDIPMDIFNSLAQDRFFYAENNGFRDVGGFIIMLDKRTLPYCGRARKDV